MTEPIPPAEPEKEPIQIAPTQGSEPPSKMLTTFLGFLLFILSGGLALLMPPVALLGFAVAIGSLFFKGYRCIFLGYILTIGVLLLAAIAYCSVHPLHID